MKNKYKVIGIMSGTSLDGLDIAYCEFEKKATWRYKIVHARTIKYTGKWKKKLSDAIGLKKSELQDLDAKFGRFIAAETLKFIKTKRFKVDFIASHGHTVFHQPEKGITLQIGSGEKIAALTGLPVVCDFRIGDVRLGGQGAPLVPIVDKILFSRYDFCLNLGGIANISYDVSPKGSAKSTRTESKRIAFDICPLNIVLNAMANQMEKDFDKGGKMAAKGKINRDLLNRLNALAFYDLSPPKSMGREWIEKEFFPVLNEFDISIYDKLASVVEHFSMQILYATFSSFGFRPSSLLITGGGAYNSFLVERISSYTLCDVVLPDDKTIQFKEAMAFAFLGVLKMRGKINILKSVTGAKRDSSGGEIYFPDQNAGSSS